MTQDQLDKLWENRCKFQVGVSWCRDGKGSDSDLMTLELDGEPARSFERKMGQKEWSEIPFLVAKR